MMMRRTVCIILVAILLLVLFGCAQNSVASSTVANESNKDSVPVANNAELSVKATEQPTAAPIQEPFPYVGTWANDEKTVFLRIKEDGSIESEQVIINTRTTTVNGVSKSSTTKQIVKNTHSWMEQGGVFLMNGVSVFDPERDGETYKLIGELITYTKVGDLNYEIVLEEDPIIDVKALAKAYSLGTKISAEGFEINLTEKGIAKDIRITSKSSGISITSGPSAEDGKQYVYLKGTIKNTSKTKIRAAIGGVVYLDDYEFELKSSTVQTSGNPSTDIQPMDTVHILLYAQITDEMATVFKKGKIIFGFNDNFDNVMLETAKYIYYVEVNK